MPVLIAIAGPDRPPAADHRLDHGPAADPPPARRTAADRRIFATGIYGGYFGAGQGILLFGLLASSLGGKLTNVNAIRAVLAGLANFVAAVVFLFIADVAWLPAALIAVGSTAGGLLGAGVGRRLSDPWLRAIIVVVGLAAIAQLVL